MNCIIIFATGIILKCDLKIIRTLISSAIGSIYAVVTYLSILEIISNLYLKIILSIVMVYIAFDSKNLKIFFKQLIIFYLTSFTFGGVAFALLYFVSPQNILMEKGVLIGTYPIKIVLAGGIVGFIIIITAFKNIKGKISRKDMNCLVKILVNNKAKCIKAIIDTGNFLKEPITKIPVMIVQKASLEDIIPKYILENLDKIINGENIDLKEYVSRIRLIPFSSLGKENGILLGIKADKILIERDEKASIVNDVIIGIYNGVLSKSRRYEALIGLEILENDGGINNYDYIRNIKV